LYRWRAGGLSRRRNCPGGSRWIASQQCEEPAAHGRQRRIRTISSHCSQSVVCDELKSEAVCIPYQWFAYLGGGAPTCAPVSDNNCTICTTVGTGTSPTSAALPCMSLIGPWLWGCVGRLPLHRPSSCDDQCCPFFALLVTCRRSSLRHGSPSRARLQLDTRCGPPCRHWASTAI